MLKNDFCLRVWVYTRRHAPPTRLPSIFILYLFYIFVFYWLLKWIVEGEIILGKVLSFRRGDACSLVRSVLRLNRSWSRSYFERIWTENTVLQPEERYCERVHSHFSTLKKKSRASVTSTANLMAYWNEAPGSLSDYVQGNKKRLLTQISLTAHISQLQLDNLLVQDVVETCSHWVNANCGMFGFASL